MSAAKVGQLWEETATGQRHLVIGADSAGAQVLINGGWRPEDLATQGYTLVSYSAATTVSTLQAKVTAIENRLTAAGIP